MIGGDGKLVITLYDCFYIYIYKMYGFDGVIVQIYLISFCKYRSLKLAFNIIEKMFSVCVCVYLK